MGSLFAAASSKCRREGPSGLLRGGVRFIRNRVGTQYYRLYHHKVRPYLPKRDYVVTLNGVEFPIKLSPFDRLMPFYEPPWPTEDEQNYEATEIESVREYCSPGDSVVVIGGGLGITAVVAARSVGDDGSVAVYEASWEAYELAKRTIEHNGLGDIITLHHAMVSSEGSVSFTYMGDAAQGKNLPPDRLPDADVYEMDCEGAEVPILEELSVKPGVILVETHRNHEDVVSHLEKHGYDVDDVVRDGRNQWEHSTHVRARHRP